ncbi:MAG: hypothetical protein QM796_06995 [Chthoniobacteraceae bacterium]
MKGFARFLFVLATLAFAFGFVVVFFLRGVGPARITEYDRAGAINEDVIKRDFPDIAPNLRYNLGRDITETHQKALLVFVSIGFAVSSFGVVLTLLPEKQKNET